MKKIILCATMLTPMLASADIVAAGSRWCASVADLAVIQSYRQDGMTPDKMVSQMSDLMDPSPINARLLSISLDVLTQAEYQWKGMSQTTVKSLAFSTCKSGLVRVGLNP